MPRTGPADTLDEAPVEGRYSFLIHRINAHLARLCNPMFRRWRVDIDLARLLAVLDERGAMAAGEIVRVMALPQSTISHQVKRLEKLGYVRRTSDLRDSRIVTVTLTEAGHGVARDSNRLSRQVTSILEAALGDMDRRAFAAALGRVDAGLTARRSLGDAP